MMGKLVGINMVIFLWFGGFNGIGFVILVYMVWFVVWVVDQGGKVQWLWFGVLVQLVNVEIVEVLLFDWLQGVLVIVVFDGFLVKVVGLEVSDFVIVIDGKEVIDLNVFGYWFVIKMIGESIEFILLCNGWELCVSILLELVFEIVLCDW